MVLSKQVPHELYANIKKIQKYNVYTITRRSNNNLRNQFRTIFTSGWKWSFGQNFSNQECGTVGVLLRLIFFLSNSK